MRTTLSRIGGYRRRRGWAAYMTASLGRFDYKDGYPQIEEVMGIPPPAAVVKPGDNVRALKLHAALAAQRAAKVAKAG